MNPPKRKHHYVPQFHLRGENTVKYRLFSFLFGVSSAAVAQDIQVGGLLIGDGFYLRGQSVGAAVGLKVAGLCDVNGDQRDDAIIQGHDTTYVLYGRAANFPAVMVPSQITPPTGVAFIGANASYRQSIPSGCADINGDGLSDILVSNPSSNGGLAYLVFGSASFPATTQLSELNGSNGAIFDSNIASVGGTINLSKDYNADGFGEVLIGAPETSNAYIIYGRNFPYPIPFLLQSLSAPNGFNLGPATGALASADFSPGGPVEIITGSPPKVVIRRYVSASSSVTLTINGAGTFGNIARSLGDVNDDGADDIGIGGIGVTSECYIFLGREFSNSSEIAINAGAGWIAAGRCGEFFSFAPAGDFNADGIDDVIIARSEAEAAVIFGSPALQIPVDFSALGNRGQRLVFDASYTGINRQSISGIGDINGDGADDIAVGIPRSSLDATSSGVVAVVYGIRAPLLLDGFED